MAAPGSAGGAASGKVGALLTLLLSVGAVAGVGGGLVALYGPGLIEKLRSSKVEAAEEADAALEEANRVGFELGSLAAGDAVQRITVTVKVGGGSAGRPGMPGGGDLAEPVDLHLGTGFPFRLYPLGTDSLSPAFAAFPQKSSLARGENKIPAGGSATFEFSTGGERGQDALNTTPQLLSGLTVGDLQRIGFASRGDSPWMLEGYRIEVNGQLFAANDSVDARPSDAVSGVQAELQEKMPGFEALAKEVSDLEMYVATGLANDADKASLGQKRAEMEKAMGPLSGLLGKATGYHPWYVEEDEAFSPGAGGGGVKSVKVTLATGGGERPGSRNPVYLFAGGKKYLLSSESDPLLDDPAPQVFTLAESDLEMSPLTLDELKEAGIGMVGNEERFANVPDRARIQRVVIEADGAEVFNSEESTEDRRTLAGISLLPPAHYDANGDLVDNAASTGELFLWKVGTVLPEEIRQAVVIEPEPDPKPDPKPDDIISPNPLIGTTQGRGRIGTPLRRFGTNPFGRFGRPNPFLTALTNFLFPIAGAGPAGAIINPPRIAPRPAIITPGSTVTVRWRATGNTAGVARYQVDLFAVLPHRGAPQVSTVPLVRGFRVPTGAARETLALTIPNPLPAGAIAGVTPVELTQLYIWPVVTAIGRLGVPISAIGRPGSMLPLYPAGTRAPAPVLTANRFNFDRGSFFQPGLSAPPPSFQFVSLAGGPLFAWTGMTRTNPGPGVVTAWSPFGLQAASNAVVFDSFEGPPVASGYSSYNTAVRPGANLIRMVWEGSVPYPSTNSGAAGALNGYRVVAHIGFIGGSVPGATAGIRARAELNFAAPISRGVNGAITDTAIPPPLPGATGFGPFFTYQTAAPIVVTNTPGAPLTLIDIPLRFNLLDAGTVAGYPVAPGFAGSPTGRGGAAVNAADFAAYNFTKATGTVGVSVTLAVQNLAGGSAADAVGIFGMRIVPDTSP